MEAKILPRWWSYLLRGLAALAFGIIILAWPKSTVKVLVILFGVFALAAGVVAIAAAIAEMREERGYFLSLALGIVSLIIGIIALTRPGTALLAILYAIAAWAILYGFLMVVSAFELPKVFSRAKWLLALTGAISVIIGITLFMLPGVSLGVIIVIVSAYLIAQGLFLVIVSFWARSLYREMAAS